jgi:two-component system chemotaxis sensor kinase CheA
MEEFIQEYKEEAASIIERIQHSLLAVNLDAENQELVEEIYRGVHTLKGSSRMFGFEQIEKLTHELENKFDQIREGKIILNKSIIDLCLKVLDQVVIVIEGNESESETESLFQEIEDYQQIEKVGPATLYQIFYVPSANIFERGINPISILDEINELGTASIFTLYASDSMDIMEKNKKFDAAFEIYLSTSSIKEDLADVFLFLEETEYSIYQLNVDGDSVETILERSIKHLKKGKRLTKKVKDQRISLINEFLNNSTIEREQSEAEQNKAEEDAQSYKREEKQVETSSLNFINVKIDRLDEMMRLVSELVTLKAHFHYRAQVLNDDILSSSVDQMEKLSNKFRDIAFNMRLVPLQILSLKFQRSVRDLGESLGKEVNFMSQGLNTEFDKSIINEIESPLLHIIRNAIDHGLETPDEREKLGKPRNGLLKISAFYEGANVFIQIQDDGKGLDLKNIKKAAVAKGIINATDQLTDQEIMNLIFQPGFSTHEKATKLSGRGVGMDVVLTKLKELRGTIKITTESGLGTTFTLRLPLSLSILDILHIKVGEVNYLIPQNEIVQCFSERLNKDQIKRSGFNMKYNNMLIPHLQLDKIFEEENKSEEEPSIIVIHKNDETISLEVHEIIGEDQLVIKPVDDTLKNLSYLSGIAVLGNGELAFLLDSFRLKNSLTDFGINEQSATSRKQP